MASFLISDYCTANTGTQVAYGPATSPQQCQTMCQNSAAGCNFFHFYNKAAYCFLKSNLGSLTYDANSFSGPKFCPWTSKSAQWLKTSLQNWPQVLWFLSLQPDNEWNDPQMTRITQLSWTSTDFWPLLRTATWIELLVIASEPKKMLFFPKM